MKGETEIPFIKMHGIGNDYIYIDALKGTFPVYLKEESLPELSKKISDRHFGVGSDGLILILPSDIADFRMRIFNADGSEAKMCGNGLRCVGKYVYDLGFTPKKLLSIETNSGVKRIELQISEKGVESVIVDMGSPFFKREDISAIGPREEEMLDQKLETPYGEFIVTGVSMGNPHGVVYVSDLDNLELGNIGRALEYHPVWRDRANIEFVKVLNRREIQLRVWERGSGETLACGTGACASVVTSFRKGMVDQNVLVHLRGGDLRIQYDEAKNKVIMEGAAKFVAKGVFRLD